MPEALHVGQQILAAALGQHRSEHLAEQADVAAQLVGHLLAGTVAFRANRCHVPHPTQIGLYQLAPGADTRA
ncbi:hypothetical protein GCM10022205_55480 [Spinactinospora alkalitolerans]